MRQFVHEHIPANPEIIWMVKWGTFYKPGVLSSAWSDPGMAGRSLKKFLWTSPSRLSFSSSALAAKGVPMLGHTSPKCTSLRDPLFPVSCGGKDRQDQAGGRDRQSLLSQFGPGMEDATLKRWRLPRCARQGTSLLFFKLLCNPLPCCS